MLVGCVAEEADRHRAKDGHDQEDLHARFQVVKVKISVRIRESKQLLLVGPEQDLEQVREAVWVLQIDEIGVVVLELRGTCIRRAWVELAIVVASIISKTNLVSFALLRIQLLEQFDRHVEVFALVLVDYVRFAEVLVPAPAGAELADRAQAAVLIGAVWLPQWRAHEPVAANDSTVALAGHKVGIGSRAALNRALVHIR